MKSGSRMYIRRTLVQIIASCVAAFPLISPAACHKDAPQVAASEAGASAVAAPGASTSGPSVPAREWQILASELPAALLSVGGRSSTDIYTVGADKGKGPTVLHYDGKGWSALSTGSHGDLWWVQAIPQGPVLMAGAGATVLRYDGQHFEHLATPGAATQTIYGVWGTSGDDFYAVGNTGGTKGFVWHYQKGGFTQEKLPHHLGDAPGFFKVWGNGEDVWVVGTAGTILHRTGTSAFESVPTTTKDTLFTIHGSGDHLITVGGSGNGVVFEAKAGGAFVSASPQGAGLLQGIFVGSTGVPGEGAGDWASGERGVVLHRAPDAKAFAQVDHGLVLPASSSLHAIFVDDIGGVWSVGGNVLSSALDNGMLIHDGALVSTVILDDHDDGTAR